MPLGAETCLRGDNYIFFICVCVYIYKCFSCLDKTLDIDIFRDATHILQCFMISSTKFDPLTLLQQLTNSLGGLRGGR